MAPTGITRFAQKWNRFTPSGWGKVKRASTVRPIEGPRSGTDSLRGSVAREFKLLCGYGGDVLPPGSGWR